MARQKGDASMSRQAMLRRVRTALGRTEGQPIADLPSARLQDPAPGVDLIALFRERFEILGGVMHLVSTPQVASATVERLLAGRAAIASNAPLLSECGVTAIAGVVSGVSDREVLRQHCATLPVGITSAEYGLAATGTLVMLAGPDNPRMISLLPPMHIAVLPAERLLAGIDHLFAVVPDPAVITSSMVLITGPSRTGDIEQISIRGVHGPGEIHVVLIG
jgi:L-lactate dehydrogenase complex protein LldG